jgi:hypothetical protein
VERKLLIDLEGAGFGDPAVGVLELEDIEAPYEIAEADHRLGADVCYVLYFPT